MLQFNFIRILFLKEKVSYATKRSCEIATFPQIIMVIQILKIQLNSIFYKYY